MNQNLFAQLAMYIGGFGISGIVEEQSQFTVVQRVLFYLGFLILSYILFTTKL